MESNSQKKFYEACWFCVLMLFLFSPVGIFLLWKYRFFSNKINIALSCIFIVWFVWILATAPQSDLTNNGQPDGTKIESVVESPTTPTPDIVKSTPTAKPTSNNTVNYDTLQQLYLDLDPNMSYTEMKKLVKSTKLPFSEEKYNGSRKIQVAFKEGCTVQEHMKESGDYLEIIYLYPDGENSVNDVLKKYSFGTCTYCPNDSALELINHVSGQYFSYIEPGNYISGLGKTIDLDKGISKKEQLDYYIKNK